MAKNEGQMLVHIDLSITMSESDYAYYDPKAYKHISFAIPKEMFTEQALARMITNRVNELEKVFPDIKKEYEAKLKEEEEKRAVEKAAKEAEELTPVDIDALLSK